VLGAGCWAGADLAVTADADAMNGGRLLRWVSSLGGPSVSRRSGHKIIINDSRKL
jgi:hypothetical protein